MAALHLGNVVAGEGGHPVNAQELSLLQALYPKIPFHSDPDYWIKEIYETEDGRFGTIYRGRLKKLNAMGEIVIHVPFPIDD
jgi:hypothetical protein